MRFLNRELESSKTYWLPVRAPHIRIAVPALFDDVKRRPAKKKAPNPAHCELLDTFQRDMDGLMPLPVSRRKAMKR